MDFAGYFMIWGALVGIMITLIGIERKLTRIAEALERGNANS